MALSIRRRCALSDWTRGLTPFGSVLVLLCLSGCGGGDESPPAAEESASAHAAAGPEQNSEPQQAEARKNRSGAAKQAKGKAGKSSIDLSYLPTDTEVVLHVRVADGLQTPLVKMLMASSPVDLENAQQLLGVSPQDIDTVTVGVSGLAALARSVPANLPPGMPLLPSGLPGGFPRGAEPEGEMPFENSTEELEEQSALPTGSSQVVRLYYQPPPGYTGGTSGHDAQRSQSGGPAGHDAQRSGSSGGPPAHDAQRPQSSGPAGHDAQRSGSSGGPPAHDAQRSQSGGPAGHDAQRSGSSGGPPAHDAQRPQSGSPSGHDAQRSNAAGKSMESIDTRQVAVFRLLKDLDVEDLEDDSVVTSAEHAGITYYVLPEGGGQRACLFVVKPRLVVVAEEQLLKGLIESRDQPTRPTSDFLQIDPEAHIAVSIVPLDREALHQMRVDETTIDEPLDRALTDHATALTLNVSLASGIGLGVAVPCDAAEGAEEVRQGLADLVSQGQAAFAAAEATLPPPLVKLLRPVVDNMGVTVEDDAPVVHFKTTLPESAQDQLAELPGLIMGMMMANALGGGEFPGGPDMMMEGFDDGERLQEVLDRGQPAADAAELPEGLRLLALVRWGRMMHFGPGPAPPVPLEIAIAAVDGPAADAVGFGQLRLTSLEPVGGGRLKWLGAISDQSEMDSPLHQFVRLNRSGVFVSHPQNGLLTGYRFHPPATPLQEIGLLEGEVTLQVAAEQKEIVIPQVRQNATAPLSDPDLAAAGVTLRLVGAGGMETLEVMYPAGTPVGTMELVDASGLPQQNTSWGRFSDGERVTAELTAGSKLPDDAGLRITLFSGVQEIPVAFRFENLAVPAPEQELSEADRAQLVWTPGDPGTELPEGLMVEAQVRWSTAGDLPGGMAPSFEFSSESFEGDDSEESEMEADEESGRFGSGQGRSPAGAAGGPRLHVLVDVTGPMALDADAIGAVKAAPLQTSGDEKLELLAVGQEMFADEEGFQEVDRTSLFAEHPPDGVRTVFQFAAPREGTQEIAAFNGSLQLRTVREQPEVLIKGIEERVGRPLTNRDLAKYGLQVVAGIDNEQLMVRLLKGSPDRIAEFIPVDDQGVEIADVDQATETGRNGQSFQVFRFAGGLPPQLGLKLILNVGMKDLEVPLRIRNLPVPPQPGADAAEVSGEAAVNR